MDKKKKKETLIEHILDARRYCRHFQVLCHLIILCWRGFSVACRERRGSELMNFALVHATGKWWSWNLKLTLSDF